MAKEIKKLTRNDRVPNPIYDYDCLEELFKNVDRLKNEKLDFRKKIELIKEVVQYCRLINLIQNTVGSDTQYKIDFDSETMDALCFYSYSDSAGNIVKIPLFLTGLYSDNALGVLDLSGLDFKNMCLSLENEEIPEEMRDVIKGWSNYGNSYFFAMSRIDFSKLDLSKFFEELYHGPTPQTPRQIDNCSFYGVDMSKIDDKGLSDILFNNCDFSNCQLNINQIVAINRSPFGNYSFNPKSRSNDFGRNKILQKDYISLSLIDVLCSFSVEDYERMKNQYQNFGFNFYFDVAEIQDKTFKDSAGCVLPDNEVLSRLFLQFIEFSKKGLFSGCYLNGNSISYNEYEHLEDLFIELFSKFENASSIMFTKWLLANKYQRYLQNIQSCLAEIVDTEILDRYNKGIPTEGDFLVMDKSERKLFTDWCEYLLEQFYSDKDKVILGGIEDFKTYREMNAVNLKHTN